MIAIIDYGAGNLKSVKKAFDYLNVDSRVISNSEKLIEAEKVVLPGVGAFGAAVEKLQDSDFYEAIQVWLRSDRPKRVLPDIISTAARPGRVTLNA